MIDRRSATDSIGHAIHTLLRTRAETTPEAVAIAAPGRTPLTYARLYEHVERTTRSLRALSLRRNDRVAMVLPNGPDMAVAFLAVASGATCAPLNPAYGAAEFEFYLSDLCAKALVVESETNSPAVETASVQGIPVIALSPMARGEAGIFTLEGDGELESDRAEWAKPDDVALVLHTSGTTSRPKMVPLTHRNLCASAHNISQAYRLTAGDRCLNVMPLFHIHGLLAAVLSTVASGGSVVCTPGFRATEFLHWVETYQPTWYTAVPTMHRAILDCAGTVGDRPASRSLRFIRSCSAALPPALMAELEARFGVPVLEAYGMTEAAHQMASNPLPPARRKPGSVGVPTGTEVAIMDEAGRLLSEGMTGEIVIHGLNVMSGYENNAQANVEAFSDGWFRTGDQGHLDEDGYLYVTGRIKEIINRGGEKVAPREVDEVLLAHPAVAQAVTFAMPHPTLGEDVATAVVPRRGMDITEPELLGWLLPQLADFKVPSQVVIVQDIPKGPTGKLQRIGLHEKLASYLATEYVAPRSSAEKALHRIWREVLSLERVGVHDNFFALGGYSLLVIQVIARVRDVFGVDLPLPTFLEAPKISALASVIETLAWMQQAPPHHASSSASQRVEGEL